MACALPLARSVGQGAPGESGNGTRPARSIGADALLAELKANTDLAALVERVVRNKLPWVVVPLAAQEAWAERDPAGWTKVTEWLALNGIAVIRV